MATIYDWATQASGTNIVTGLTATAAEYQGQITIGTVTYGLIQYTFSGSPTLSSVLAGHRLNVSDMTNAENNATGLVVYSADDSADTITVRSTVRTDATKDETGSSGSASVTTAGAAVQKPSDSYINQGFLAPGKPSDAYWNWVISQMASIVQSVDSRSNNVYSGPSTISSSTYTDLDGQGVSFGFDGVASDQTWTASANDGAYESIAGVNLDPITKESSAKVLHIFTAQTDSGISRPIDYRLQVDTVTQYSVLTNVGGYATGDTQSAFSQSNCFVDTGLSASTSYDFDVQAARYTGLTSSALRAWAIELHPQDDSGNNLVRFYSSGITEGTYSSSYADLTGYTTGSQTYQNGNKVLILYGGANYVSSGGISINLKLQKDGVDNVEFSGIDVATTGVFDVGEMVSFSRVVDVTGSHTFKIQGTDSLGTGKYAGGGEGYFGAIELPATYAGDTLMRSVNDASGTVNSTSYAEVDSTGSVTTNGHRVLMLLSGKCGPGGTDGPVFKFKVDGADVSGEYNIDRASAYDSIVNLMFITDELSAGSHTFSVDGKIASSFATLTNMQFAAFEIPIAARDAGNAPEVTLTDTTGKKIELMYTGSLNSANAEVGFQITENIDGGGAAADGNPFTFTPQAGEDTPFTFRTIVDAPASGSTAVYKLQGKVASGTCNVSAGEFTAREVAADGS